MRKEIKKQIAKKEKKLIDFNWIIKVTILSFVISFSLSGVSETVIPNVNLVTSIILLIVFILLGIIFDMIGVAITASDPAPFHSMNSRRVGGAKMAVKLQKNASKVASFCNDVIGDVSGIISGSVGVTITLSLSSSLGTPLFITTLFVTGIIASLTIGGKAICKSIAMNKSNEIIYVFAKIISFNAKSKKK